MEKKIVIIGAGYAGILTAKKLAKKLKKYESINITIIDKNPFHTMLTELHEVAACRVDEDSIKIGLKKVFAGRKVNIKLDIVTSVDLKEKVVKGIADSYPYDYLVLAAGSKPTFYNTPGAEENTYKLWSYEDAVILRERIHQMFREATREINPGIRKKLLTFYVIGAGFTGVEMIGELAEYIPILCEKFEIDRSEVKLVIVDGLSRPIPNLPEKLSAKVTKRLQKMGVELSLNTLVTNVGTDYIELKRDDKVSQLPVGTIIWAAGIQSSDITEQVGNNLEVQRGGRIQVDQYLRATRDNNVYIVGDNMYYIPEGEESPAPQMVENCEQSAHTAAHNIIYDITTKGELKVYRPVFHGVMVSIGGRYGVAHVGFPKHFFSLPSFFAMFAKHIINIIYFIQVLGWNKGISYVKHEFFTIRNCRSFVGGHFSNRTSSFLLVPLRVWLGIVWFFEGVIKIVDGWFVNPKLTSFFGSATSWYNGILYPSDKAADVTNTTDAISAATGVIDGIENTAEQLGKVLVNFNFLGLFKVLFVTGKDLASSTLGDYAFKIDIPVINWFVNELILPHEGTQLAMQIFIVIAEILVGLALIGGLLNTPASIFSLVLQFMFVCTTGLFLGTFWMIFAAVAVLIGGGKTFGLDYYVMPKLKGAWKRLPLIRKLYIYND